MLLDSTRGTTQVAILVFKLLALYHDSSKQKKSLNTPRKPRILAAFPQQQHYKTVEVDISRSKLFVTPFGRRRR
jgi:hypothetical protein